MDVKPFEMSFVCSKMIEKQQASFDRVGLENLWRRLRENGPVKVTCRDLARHVAKLGVFQLQEYEDGGSGSGRKTGTGWKLVAWPAAVLMNAENVEQAQVGYLVLLQYYHAGPHVRLVFCVCNL